MIKPTAGMVAFGLLLASSAATAGDADDLWSRAVQSVSRARNVMPKTIVATFHGRDPEAGVDCRREATLTLLGFDDKGIADWDVVYTEDLLGKVPSGGVNCRYGPKAHGELQLPFNCSPLDDRAQVNVSHEETADRRDVDGTDCIVYEFEWKHSCQSKKPVQGEACIEPATAVPLEVRFAPRPPPRGIRAAELRLYYEDLGDLGANVVRFQVDMWPKSRKGDVEPFRFTGKLTGHHRMRPD